MQADRAEQVNGDVQRELAYLEAAPIGVVVVNQRGQIEQVNTKAEEIFGYTREELFGQSLEILLPQRFRTLHKQHRTHYFEEPHSRPMGLGMELLGLRKDGTEFPVEVGLSHIEIDGQSMAVSFISDITVRVQAAEALRRHASELEERVAERTREIERRRQVAEGLHDILTILNTARPLEEILDYIVDQAHRLLTTDAVAIYRQDAETNQPLLQAARYPEEASDLDVTPFAADPQQMSEETEMSSMARTERFRSVLTVPLNVKGEVYGNICLYYRNPRSFSAEERELAVAFADQAALAIENSRLREQVERSAVAAERNRLARDLHDAVTQTLFSTSLIAEVLPRIWERHPEEGKRRLAELRGLTRGALAEMRTMLLELRPSALTDARLEELLQQLAEAVTGRARIPVSVAVHGEGTLPVDTKVAFYRIAQEALNNVAKHSRAGQASVDLCYEPRKKGVRATLTIEDNGRGFELDNLDGGHLGLGIMRERAEAIDAQLTIDSTPGKGTRVRVEWNP